MGRLSELQVQSHRRIKFHVVGGWQHWYKQHLLCVVVVPVGEVWRKKGLKGTTCAVIDSYRSDGVNRVHSQGLDRKL